MGRADQGPIVPVSRACGLSSETTGGTRPSTQLGLGQQGAPARPRERRRASEASASGIRPPASPPRGRLTAWGTRAWPAQSKPLATRPPQQLERTNHELRSPALDGGGARSLVAMSARGGVRWRQREAKGHNLRRDRRDIPPNSSPRPSAQTSLSEPQGSRRAGLSGRLGVISRAAERGTEASTPCRNG